MFSNSRLGQKIIEKWNHVGFQKYFRNMGWLLFARIISFVTSFLTVAIVARYLGPENLGRIEYAQSFVAIISVFASLGIDQILYRDLISHPEKQGELLGTAIFSKLVFGAVAFLLSIIVSSLLNNDLILTVLIGICALSFIINPISTVSILFNAQVKAKYSSQISIALAFFIPLLKLLIIFLDQGIIYFALVIVAETIVSTIWSLLIYMYNFKMHPSSWKFNADIFKRLLMDSWPLFLAGFSGYVYAKIDQVLILHYLNPLAVGIYGVAVKLTQIWAFLPGLIIGSMFPAIINAKKVDFQSYSKRFRALSGLTIAITVLIALPLYIFAPLVIKIVFGEAFLEAAPILRIYLWVSVAITLVVLVQHYLVAENLSKIFLYTSIVGAMTNIVLNVFLIPRYGTIGSAWGTMLSYLAAALSLFLFKKSRDGMIKIFT